MTEAVTDPPPPPPLGRSGLKSLDLSSSPDSYSSFLCTLFLSPPQSSFLALVPLLILPQQAGRQVPPPGAVPPAAPCYLRAMTVTECQQCQVFSTRVKYDVIDVFQPIRSLIMRKFMKYIPLSLTHSLYCKYILAW